MTDIATSLSEASREAFRIRHNADMQLANIGITALNLVGAEHRDLHEAAYRLFKGDQNKMGLWFIWPSTDFGGKAPLEACREGNVQQVKNVIAWKQALAAM